MHVAELAELGTGRRLAQDREWIHHAVGTQLLEGMLQVEVADSPQVVKDLSG